MGYLRVRYSSQFTMGPSHLSDTCSLIFNAKKLSYPRTWSVSPVLIMIKTNPLFKTIPYNPLKPPPPLPAQTHHNNMLIHSFFAAFILTTHSEIARVILAMKHSKDAFIVCHCCLLMDPVHTSGGDGFPTPGFGTCKKSVSWVVVDEIGTTRFVPINAVLMTRTIHEVYPFT